MEVYPAQPAFALFPILLLGLLVLVVIIGLILIIRASSSNRPAGHSGRAGPSPSRSERTSLLRERRDRYQQERTRILGMVDSNQISAAEAAQLLDSVERETSTMACPFCGEDIRVEALKCHHCGQYLVEDDIRPKRLTRSNNKVLAGVCAGLADYAGLDPSLVRILVAVVAFCSGIIAGLLIYLVAALIIPEAEA